MTARVPAVAYGRDARLLNEFDACSSASVAEVTSTYAGAGAERFRDGPVDAKSQAHAVTVQRADSSPLGPS